MLRILNNNKLKLLSLVLLIISSVVYGQIYTEEQEKVHDYVKQVENTPQQPDSLLFRMDSILVNVKRTKNKLATTSHFLNSNTDLMMNFFFKEDSLILVNVKEQSKKFDEHSRFSNYYILNNKINSKHHSGTVKSDPQNFNSSESYGYNKTFSSAFLEQYMAELLTDIRLQPPGAWKKEISGK